MSRYIRVKKFLNYVILLGKTHIKKVFFFSGQTTKVLPSLHQWLSGGAWNGFNKKISFTNFWAKKAGFIDEKKVVFCLVAGGGVYPPYTNYRTSLWNKNGTPPPIPYQTVRVLHRSPIYKMTNSQMGFKSIMRTNQ